MMKWSAVILIFGIFFPHNIGAQNQFVLSCFGENNHATQLLERLFKSDGISSGFSPDEELKLLSILYQNGYVEAKIDSSRMDENAIDYYFFLGKQYRWRNLRISPELALILNESGYRKVELNTKIFEYKVVTDYFESIISYYENRGYPFVTTYLDSMEIFGDEVSAVLKVQKGNYYEIDTIFFNNEDLISADYIQKIIDIAPGDAYSESKINLVKNRINNLEFLGMGEAFLVHFDSNRAWIDLSVKKRKSNSFDGILGFFSDNKTGKIAFNGNLNLKLMNAFKTGETIKFNWVRPQAGFQTLNLFYSQPYLFKTHLGFDYSFELYRQDSSFTNVHNKPIIAYRLGVDDYISVYAAHFLSQISPFYLDTNRRSFSSLSFGMGFNRNNLDYKPNPRRGYNYGFNLEAGNKTFNDEVSASFDTQKSLKAKVELQGEIFFPLLQNSTIKIANRSAIMMNDNLFENELFRIGGFNSLRGFDEESVLASSFSIFDVEYRLLIQRNSNISLFYNFAFTEKAVVLNAGKSAYQGFGAGFSFDTGSGILSLFYALGNQFGNQVVLRNSKIHFGYSAKF